MRCCLQHGIKLVAVFDGALTSDRKSHNRKKTDVPSPEKEKTRGGADKKRRIVSDGTAKKLMRAFGVPVLELKVEKGGRIAPVLALLRWDGAALFVDTADSC